MSSVSTVVSRTLSCASRMTPTIAVLCLLATHPGRSWAVGGRTVPKCTEQQLLASVPRDAEVSAHRQFKPVTIIYPFGTKLDRWGFEVTARIDAAGRVLCYALGPWNAALQMNGRRRLALETLQHWQYAPCLHGEELLVRQLSPRSFMRRRPRGRIARSPRSLSSGCTWNGGEGFAAVGSAHATLFSCPGTEAWFTRDSVRVSMCRASTAIE
jgi:hypothetical protein